MCLSGKVKEAEDELKRLLRNEEKNCILETGYEVSEGEFNPFGENKAERKK